MSQPELQCQTVISQPFEENTYVAWLAGSSECIIVDPGFEPEKIVDLLGSEGLVPAALLNTHGHSDHIAGNAAIKQHWPDCPLVIGEGDAPKLIDPNKNLSAPFGLPMTSPPADQKVRDGEVLTVAGMALEVLDTPGHSCGHVVFVWKQTSPWIVFGGDVLFRGSIGRTDFPDGDFDQLARAIREKLFTMPEDTVVLPGHGPSTTTGHEMRTNHWVGLD